MVEIDPLVVKDSQITLELAVGAIITECIIYALYFPVFIASVLALFSSIKDDASNQARRMLACSSMILFLLITSCLAELFLSLRDPVVSHFYPTPDSALFYTTRSSLLLAVCCVADAIFTFRLFHVWGGKWWAVVFPVLSMLATVGCSPFMLAGQVGLVVGVPSLVINLYITCMISYKIWRNDRAMQGIGQPGMSYIILIILESAGVYTGFAAFACISQFAGNNFLSLATQAALAPSAGLSYSLMILLVARRRSEEAKLSTLPFQVDLPNSRLSSDFTVNL
ncbi:hypothetical protein ONZ45_g9062 [Pleurotus djamor]|nr:hypothetical protein ONZ45_g9062 [Pleurotus djamor]